MDIYGDFLYAAIDPSRYLRSRGVWKSEIGGEMKCRTITVTDRAAFRNRVEKRRKAAKAKKKARRKKK